MSITTSIDFTTATDYTYGAEIEIVADKAQLVLSGTYPVNNPTIVYDTAISTDGLESFVETSTKIGSDEIKYTITKNDIVYWWDGASWAVSTNVYTEANTAADINTNAATFTTVRVDVTVTAFLHSDDGSTTPALDVMVLTYSYGGTSPDVVDTVWVSGNRVDSQGTAVAAPFSVFLLAEFVKYKTNVTIKRNIVTVTPDSTGYWETSLVETTNMVGTNYYVFDFDTGAVLRQVPNTSTSYDFGDLT